MELELKNLFHLNFKLKACISTQRRRVQDDQYKNKNINYCIYYLFSSEKAKLFTSKLNS